MPPIFQPLSPFVSPLNPRNSYLFVFHSYHISYGHNQPLHKMLHRINSTQSLTCSFIPDYIVILICYNFFIYYIVLKIPLECINQNVINTPQLFFFKFLIEYIIHISPVHGKTFNSIILFIYFILQMVIPHYFFYTF